jgi:hypothetical protein
MLLGSVTEQVLRSVYFPGHYRGTGGSSRGAEQLSRTRRAACHQSQRGLSPERSACLLAVVCISYAVSRSS